MNETYVTTERLIYLSPWATITHLAPRVRRALIFNCPSDYGNRAGNVGAKSGIMRELFDGPYASTSAQMLVASQPGRRGYAMKWVTREHPKTDRIACPWLIRKFIDPDAEIVYVPRDQVIEYAEREGATSFDAPGAKYTHRGNKCSFETLIDEYGINDPAVTLLARVVHGADVSEDRDATPESRGLLAIADGFALLGIDDQRQLELELPVYDALYAWAQDQVSAA
ncbi:MAG TPA: chromate resistance protein ChrB domain-containing protein [Candidatus Limnocylindrales bacterium]